MEKKSSTYKGQTDARRRANAKYQRESIEDIKVRVSKGQKEMIRIHAEKQGESMNRFIIRAIKTVMDSDNANQDK